MKYVIIYEDKTILSIQPSGGQLLTMQNIVIDTLEHARTMLASLGVDVTPIDTYIPDND